MKDAVDYSLYLVTDNTPAILGGRDLVTVVRAAVEGGVTVVQLRDKTSDTGSMIQMAKRLHEVTKEYNVPLLINDRVDVALAAGVEGVHIGQDDMDLSTARKLLGDDAIIGVSASSVEEAITAAKGGADYLGLGTIFSTATKENTKSIIGTAGLREILLALSKHDDIANIKTVCIGGINASNCQRVQYQSIAKFKRISGVAIVSAIIAAPDPKTTSTNLLHLVRTPPPFDHPQTPLTSAPTPSLLSTRLPPILASVATSTPICHNMTNLVVQNLAANVALCLGGSPIMSTTGAEAPDLARLGGSLVLNMGTANPDALTNYTLALRAYNAAGAPVVLDPVGAGATAHRRAAVRTLLASGYFDVIKGNENEIAAVWAATATVGDEASAPQQRGVDSAATGTPLADRAQLTRALARREKNVVLMTGATDVLSDGATTLAISNGHALLGAITGSGCTLGTAVAACLAVARGEKMAAVLAGVLAFEIAAERAAERGEVRGPGTFVPAFLDELWRVRGEVVEGNEEWLGAARVEVVELEEED